MIEITYSVLCRNQNFAMAMQKLVSTPCSHDLAKSIMKLNEGLTKAKRHVETEYKTKILDVFTKRDDKGNIVMKKDSHNEFEVLDGKDDDLKAAQDIFWDTKAEIGRKPLFMGNLAEIKMSAQELDALQPICIEMAVAEEATAS